MFNGIDLSSDTATQPTLAMKEAMLSALLGDEQRKEDPTTAELETEMAKLLGQESALFLPSATMANIMGINLLCEPGDVLITADQSHLILAEGGGPAIHSQVLIKPIVTPTGIFSGDALENAYRFDKGPRYPRSRAVSIENTTNLSGGIAWSAPQVQSVLDKAKALNLRTHLDGARLFNAAIKIRTSPKTFAQGFDDVTICLSKGLGCPVGAILAFKNHYAEKAERLKHLFGGAMRQTGMLAAAGLYALEHHIERLEEDHQHAALFSDLLSSLPNITVEHHPMSTNMVFFSWAGTHKTSQQFHEACMTQGFRFSQVGQNRFRVVFHLGVSEQEVLQVAACLKSMKC